jgi:rSAM/selenodomain-associated transferase 2
MEIEPRVSIIIPTLNEEVVLENVLRFLCEIKREYPLELIVVDGGSTDHTLQIATRYADKVVLTSPGRGEQLNRGAERASGEILWFLHADTRIESNSILSILSAIESGSGGGCFRITFDSKRLIYRSIAWGSNLRAKWLKSFYGDQGIFVEWEIFKNLGGFRPIPLMEDLEFSQRLKSRTQVKVVASTIQTSSRRFQKGTFRTLLRMQVLKIGFHLGVDPKTLAKAYGLGRG